MAEQPYRSPDCALLRTPAPRLCFHVCRAGDHLIYQHDYDEVACEAFETRLAQGQIICEQCAAARKPAPEINHD